MITSVSDYQEYVLGKKGFESIGARMLQKLKAIPIPDLKGKKVLDIGCDAGFWSWGSIFQGAESVMGIDRNREIRGKGLTDLVAENNKIAEKQGWNAKFLQMNLGKQWYDLGVFDVVYMFSLYHHIYQNCGGDHKPIWYWLRRQLWKTGEILWENPISSEDSVVQMNVDKDYWGNYTKAKILEAASEFFTYEYIGPALHEPYREVYRFRPLPLRGANLGGLIIPGFGGAAPCFNYADRRRCLEFQNALGWFPYAGSINIKLDRDFMWNENYYRVEILDVKDREIGLEGEWIKRWARLYPVIVPRNEHRKCVIFRFEGDNDEIYRGDFVELIADGYMPYPNLLSSPEELRRWNATWNPKVQKFIVPITLRVTK